MHLFGIVTITCVSWIAQGLPQGGTLYVMGGQADSQPRMLGVLSRIQLAPMTVQIQGDSAAQAFSSVFSDRRSGLFDSSLSTWSVPLSGHTCLTYSSACSHDLGTVHHYFLIGSNEVHELGRDWMTMQHLLGRNVTPQFRDVGF